MKCFLLIFWLTFCFNFGRERINWFLSQHSVLKITKYICSNCFHANPGRGCRSCALPPPFPPSWSAKFISLPGSQLVRHRWDFLIPGGRVCHQHLPRSWKGQWDPSQPALAQLQAGTDRGKASPACRNPLPFPHLYCWILLSSPERSLVQLVALK